MKTLLAFLAGIAAAVSVRAAATTTITNSVGMEFVSIPAGSFTYGRFQPPSPDRKSTRLNSSHIPLSRMPSSA